MENINSMSIRCLFLSKFIRRLVLLLVFFAGSSAWADVDEWTAMKPIGGVGSIAYIGVYKNGLMAFDPNNPNNLFVAAQNLQFNDSTSNANVYMLYRSNNAGKSWKIAQEQVGWSFDKFSHGLAELTIAPSDSRIMYLLSVKNDTSEISNVYRSNDGGVHWTQQTKNKKIQAITVHPQKPDVLYAYSSILESIVKSTDGGINWTSIGMSLKPGFRGMKKIHINKINPEIIYLSSFDVDGSSIYDIKNKIIRRSDDGGITWQQLSGEEADIPLEIKIPFSKVSKSGEIVYQTSKYSGGDFLSSHDGGINWNYLGFPEYLHSPQLSWVDIRKYSFEIYPDPNEEDTVRVLFKNNYINGRWSLLKSVDAGVSWQDITEIKIPMGTKEYYLTPEPTDYDTPKTYINPFSINKHVRLNETNFLESMDSGSSWQIISQTPVKALYLKFSRSTKNTLYFVDWDRTSFYRSSDHGQSWNKIYTANGGVSHFYEHPTDKDTFYVYDYACALFGSCTPKLMMKTTDGGETWTDIGAETVLPGTQITYTEVQSMTANGSTHYAATTKGIYVSYNSGSTWEQFTHAGLPFAEMPVYEIRIDATDKNVLYADTETGIFVYGKDAPASINSVEATTTITTGQPLTLAIYGNFADSNRLILDLDDCDNPTKLEKSDDLTQYIQCDMSGTAGDKKGIIKDDAGETLHEFSITSTIATATIDSISPLIANEGETLTFTVEGNSLSQDIHFNLANCASVQTVAAETCTETQCQFTCTPNTAGIQIGSIQDSSNTDLYTFEVDVQAKAVVEPEVSQCSVYSPNSAPQISLPCVNVNGKIYSAELNAVPDVGMRFAVDMKALQNVDIEPNEECAVYPSGEQNRLRMNCLDVGGEKLWVELDLVPNAAGLEFDLADYGNP